MESGDDTSEYATVRTPVGCRSVRLPTSPDYARNIPIMLESVPIMLTIYSIFPGPYYARHYAGIIHPSLLPGQRSWCCAFGFGCYAMNYSWAQQPTLLCLDWAIRYTQLSRRNSRKSYCLIVIEVGRRLLADTRVHRQGFIQRGGALGFPPPSLSFPPQKSWNLAWCLVKIVSGAI